MESIAAIEASIVAPTVGSEALIVDGYIVDDYSFAEVAEDDEALEGDDAEDGDDEESVEGEEGEDEEESEEEFVPIVGVHIDIYGRPVQKNRNPFTGQYMGRE